jgi:2-iminoacetate synthase
VEDTARRICDPEVIGEWLDYGRGASAETVRDILYRARASQGLEPGDVAVLIQVQDEAVRAEVLKAARQLHERIHERRVGLLAPVCPSNRCVNDCLYCPLRRSNARLRRKVASAVDVQREVLALLDEGYRQLQLVFGEDLSGVPYVRDMMWATYGARSGLRQIQRVDLNLNPLRVTELSELSQSAGAGTYHVYQETYHPEAYAALHQAGPKADYAWRLTCHDRACEAGFRDIGLGVLLGAHDFRFDVVAVVAHSRYLSQTCGCQARSITYPRMIPAQGAPASHEAGRQVSDADFCYAAAVTRLAEPFASIVLCTPADREVRLELYGVGVSQVSVGSLSYPGVYTADGDVAAAGNLTIGRPRGLEDLVYRMCEAGFVPNFCVACYANMPRRRAGADGLPEAYAADHSAANSLLALKEYLMDHASPETANMGERLIQQELGRLSERERNLTVELMEEIEAGMRRQML